ncbi:unnamed protein product [Cunninghamella echinulata]
MRSIGVPPTNGEWMSQANMLRHHSIKLDLVAEQERVWIKIFARNTKAIRHDMDGLEWHEDEDDDSDNDFFNDSENDDDEEITSDKKDNDDNSNTILSTFEHLPIFKKAKTYLSCSQLYQYHYKPPVVVFAFMKVKENEDPFVQKIMDRLKEMGICIYLQQQQEDNDDKTHHFHSLRNQYLPYLKERGWDPATFTATTAISSQPSQQQHKDGMFYSLTTEKLNLDVSTVLAMISELSHHVCQVDEVDGEALKLQAAMELKHAVLNDLNKILKGKQLCIVQSAFDRLKSIIQVVAGPQERKRFNYLFPNEKIIEKSSTEDTTTIENDDDNDDGDDLWTILEPPQIPITILPNQPSLRFQQLLELPPKSAKHQPGSKLNNGRKIRCRFTDFHANIFGTADTYRMSSVTSIQWMPSALIEAGVTGMSIVIHDPRSLAEQKMHSKK